MNLHFISIIPLELFTVNNSNKLEQKMINYKMIQKSNDQLSLLFEEMGKYKARMYNIIKYNNDKNIKIGFYESSVCLYFENIIHDWEISKKSVIDILKIRNIHHTNIINNSEDSVIYEIFNKILYYIDLSKYNKLKINYVFSFFIIESNDLNIIPNNLLKILTEPSSIDLDDMISSKAEFKEKNISIKNKIKLKDVDISNYTKTFITWATIVSISSINSVNKTKYILSSIENVIQITWNRCYTISMLIDDIFDDKLKIKDISELYWNFVKTLDDAKSVLSSTYSSRADKFFSEIIKTSKLELEINRLEQKINMLEKYINQKNHRINNKYQKTIELLLFITAIASLIQILLPLPINFISIQIKYFFIFFISIIGIVAIYKKIN